MAKVKKSAQDGYQLFKKLLRSGEFGKLYVLTGDEPFLVQSCRAALKKKLVEGPAEDFNYHRFNQETWDIDAFRESVDAIPMLSDRSLVEVTDIDFFALPEGGRNQLTEIFSDLPDYCTVVFVYDTVAWKPDKRMKKLYAAFDGAATVLEMNRQPERELIPWIKKLLAKAGKTMPDDLIRYLILQTGGAMTTISAELQKLVCYSDQPELHRSDIDDVVIPVLEAAVFDITKDIGSRSFDAALQKLRDLLRQDTEPIMIAAVIGRQLRQMYAAKVLAENGKDAYALMSLYGIRDFAAREVYGQARGYQKSQLQAGMRLMAETDYAMKTSGGDSAALLEEAILRLAQLGGAA